MRSLHGALLASIVAVAWPTASAAAQATAQSDNWAGYAVARSGVSFEGVSASWTVPAVTCQPGQASYSAAWVGLGGDSETSSALEQIGTESDCDDAGDPVYSAWSELVPRAAAQLPLSVRPGDRMSASVSVVRLTVRMRITDVTTGDVATKTLQASAVDTSSAEWIVEAPSACAAGGSLCRVLPLAGFGTTRFITARATTAGGYRGAIADPHWSRTAIALAPSGPVRGAWPGAARRLQAEAPSGSASPGPLSTSGGAFAVAFAAPPSAAVPPSSTGAAVSAELDRRRPAAGGSDAP
jgi:hypothetical protein